MQMNPKVRVVYPCVRYGLVDGKVESRVITGPLEEQEGWQQNPEALKPEYLHHRLWPLKPAEPIAEVQQGSQTMEIQPLAPKNKGGRPRKIQPEAAQE